MMVQLLIMYFVIFASSQRTILVAVLAFGINSGAYVAEIIRSGIMAVDAGQMEAGRSLGLNYGKTMRYIIIPRLPTPLYVASMENTKVSPIYTASKGETDEGSTS